MSEPIQPATVHTVQAPAVVQKLSLRQQLLKWFVELAAISIWLYSIIHLVVFDVDRYIVKRLPWAAWIFDFKLILILTVAALTVFIVKRYRLWKQLAYVVFYPAIVVLLKLPFFILRQRSWPLAIAFINAVVSFFGSITYNLFVAAAVLGSSSIILFSDNRVLLWTSIATLWGLVTLAYIRRFVSVFKPPRVFRFYEKIVGLAPKMQRLAVKGDEKVTSTPYNELTPEQAEKWNSNLQTSFFLSRACLFAARKLRSYGRSGFGKISSAFICVFLTAVTVVVFAFINFGIYKVDPASFGTIEAPTRFTFVHYSFNRMIFNSIPELEPRSTIAKLSYDSEAMFAFFLVVIFASLLLSTRTQRQVDELNETIRKIEAESHAMDLAIAVEFHFASVDTALTTLEQRRAGTRAFLRLLSDVL